MNVSHQVNYESKGNPPDIERSLFINHDSLIPANSLNNTVATWAISASPMAKYLYRTCPKCKDYLGVVVPEPSEPMEEVPIDAHCAVCGFKLSLAVILGKKGKQ